MICLYSETHFSNLTLILYTCLLLPLLQFLRTAAIILTFIIDPHRQIHTCSTEATNPEWDIDLPVSQLQDLDLLGLGQGEGDQEACSICLMEFLRDDKVNKLPRCGHVFHIDCLEKWLDGCHFTCPLCRTSVFQIRSSSPCKNNAGFCTTL